MAKNKTLEEKYKDLQIDNLSNCVLVIGCNYHTTWQSHKRMRFVLTEIKGTKARLQTRTSQKDFWTDLKDLIFIETAHNKRKAIELSVK